MAYQGYGSKSAEAERKRRLAESLAPQNVGAPVNGLAGGFTQLAQALMARKANKQADKLDAAHRDKIATALKGATANLSPDAQAFAQAFPEQFAQMQAKNMFPDQAAAARAAADAQKTQFSQGMQTKQFDRQGKMFDYQMGRDIAGDKIAAEQRTYQQGRDTANDQFKNKQFAYNQGQDAISNQLRGRQVDATVAKANKTDLGKTPIYLRGEDGAVSIGQLGNGQIVPAQVAEGMTVVDPMQKSMMQQQGRSQGKIQGEAVGNMDNVISSADLMKKTIGQLKNHKGLSAGTGASSLIPAFPGTAKRAFNAADKQVHGQVFLQAYETLKGGGVITEIEGTQGKQALARLDKAQSEEDYVAALNDLEAVVDRGILRAQRRAGLGGQQQSEAPKTLTYNPQTGELE